MWEKDFLAVHNGTMDMLFADFVDVYAPRSSLESGSTPG